MRLGPSTIGASAVFAASRLVAADGVPGWEEATFHAVNDLPGWLEPVLWPPMQLGSLWGPVVVSWATWRRWRSWRAAVGVLVGGVAAWQLAKVVKSGTRRGRPADELERISLRRGTPREGLGFVSGHTTVAFAMVAVLWPRLGVGARVVATMLATVVALARIHVGAHLPVDAIGGAALGVVVGEVGRVVMGDDVVEPSEESS